MAWSFQAIDATRSRRTTSRRWRGVHVTHWLISTQVHGYGAAGAALVSGGIDKCIFVGSPEVGKIVMETASKTLTPVVLELGGKDPFVVCDDCSASDLDRISQIALRGVFQSMGQNCAGPERSSSVHKFMRGFYLESNLWPINWSWVRRMTTRKWTAAR